MITTKILVGVAVCYGIWKLLTKSKRQQIIDWWLRLLGCYDSRGLRYSIAHLEKIKKDMIHWPRKKQAKYVDRTLRDLVSICLENRYMLTDAHRHFPTFNATSIGNLAYLALYSYDDRVKKQAEKVLEDYKNWLVRNGVN